MLAWTAVRSVATRLLPPIGWLVAGGAFLVGPPADTIAAAASGLLTVAYLVLGRTRPGRMLPLHAIGGITGVALLAWSGWPAVIPATLSMAALVAAAMAEREASAQRDRERQDLARQLDRRINEIFSLQELSYILADSLRSERIAERVARYVTRFLNAEGAALALLEEDGRGLRVAAAEGSLARFVGARLTDEPPSLVVRAIVTERIEVGRRTEEGPVRLLPELEVESGAAAPLRAHGLAMGVLAVADRRDGGFRAEDLWLLSTVATQVAVVLANSRLFEMVRQAKEEWETAFNALTEGIAVLDRRGRIVRGNRALARMLNMPAPALMGRPFWAEVAGDAAGEEWLISAADAGERPAPLVVRSQVIDKLLRLTVAPLAEPTAEAALVVLVADVTEQRTLEAQLIQSEKLAAVGQLVSGVAHELNNPLTSIAGLSEFLQERPGLGAEREHLRVIHEQATRAGRIVRNLLTFARRGVGADEVVDLDDVIERTTQVVAYELGLRGITLTRQRGASTLPVRGSRDELQQVVVNLVANAIHAVRDLPPGAPREIAISTAVEDGQAIVRVRDTGRGVRQEHERELFTPFFTTKEPGEGTGLGLSLSYRIIDSHGGRLSYAPAAEGGAEFTFALPLAAASAPAPAPASAPDSRAALLVDGDPGLELVVRALLEPAGIGVECCAGASEGLRRLTERPWTVAILDGALSVDGRQLLAEQVTPPAGTRLVVASGDPALAARCRARGIPVLPRPFLPRDLIGVVGDLLGG